MKSDPTMGGDGLVERLRVSANVCEFNSGGFAAPLANGDILRDAADRIKALEGERDEALDRIEELERDAEIVSTEFEKDCWIALRSLIARCDPKFDFNRDGEGTTAQDACDFLWEAMEGCEERLTTSEALVTSLRNQLEGAKEALKAFAVAEYVGGGWEAMGPVYVARTEQKLTAADFRLAASTLYELNQEVGSSNASPSPLDATRHSSNPDAEPAAEQWLRDVGGICPSDGQWDECWVPCAKGDPGARLFVYSVVKSDSAEGH